MTDDRLAELAAALVSVRSRLDMACRAVGRPSGDVTLIAVSKGRPAADVLRLASLGIVDFGESYDQEAAAKAAALAASGVDVRWHFVGRLQRNKCRSVASYADVVHSVDRAGVADALAAGAARAGRRVAVLVQVALDADPENPGSQGTGGTAPADRGGARPADVPALAAHVAGLAGLDLRGVMAVAPPGEPARPAFARLRAVAEAVRGEHPGAELISAGMTGDLDEAVAEGATHVRVGTALFGERLVRG